MPVIKAVTARIHLVVLSIYLYNERQGFLQLEALLKAFRQKYPQDQEMAAAIAKHAADEKKHYLMFRNYFEQTGQMPLSLDERIGYVELFILHVFHRPLKMLRQEEILSDEKAFFRLCRVILMTESRGLKQVKWLLKTRWLESEPRLRKIFQIIERDEPSHFLPYQSWLRKHGADLPTFRERAVELWIHGTLVFFRIPALYFKFRNPRLKEFPY